MEIDYLNSEYILERNIKIEGITVLLIKGKDNKENIPTIILYHGWSSRKEFQRIRGYLLAMVGYQVIIPDAIYHGERNSLKNYDIEDAKEYFWEIILQNLKEADILINSIIENYNGDRKRIGVIGNSMGGITASGVFTHYPLNTLVVLNGSGDWNKFNDILISNEFGGLNKKDILLYEEIIKYDPANNLDKLKERPILLLHGKDDSLVPIESQESFYNKVKEKNICDDKIKFIKYDNLNHFVTTNMMEESINWFKKNMI